ncbi:MAG: cyclic nucleotide-binding domain-containing protein [Alphaproteobacteria bacterium]
MIEKSAWSNIYNYAGLKILARFMEAYRVAQGREVYGEGAHGACLFLLLEGRVNVSKQDTGHAKKEITTIGAGKTFGEMSLIDGRPHSATVVAATDTVLLVLTRERFDQLMEEFPRLGAKLLLQIARMISQRLRQTSGVLVDYLGATE